jgi:hypothetical protein
MNTPAFIEVSAKSEERVVEISNALIFSPAGTFLHVEGSGQQPRIFLHGLVFHSSRPAWYNLTGWIRLFRQVAAYTSPAPALYTNGGYTLTEINSDRGNLGHIHWDNNRRTVEWREFRG